MDTPVKSAGLDKEDKRSTDEEARSAMERRANINSQVQLTGPHESPAGSKFQFKGKK